MRNERDKLHRWSWGAFTLNWIWGIGNSTYIMLLGLIPGLGLIMSIIGGIKGYEWAYDNGDWDSIDDFLAQQKGWNTAGVVILIVGLVVTIGLAVLGIVSYSLTKTQVNG
ncbi:ribonuclease G [Periweissella cryptocerci]|uniref:Ribonuclease G n=1 Tax=Periweissella cryptocerci TaxID=2506420 RepID=A0A4P6YRD2_9LACO|nr:ribonuclease G [Periweissella cryptocerci]QBO35171.1 ribonuclease G [Periweissella cryptocerci]